LSWCGNASHTLWLLIAFLQNDRDYYTSQITAHSKKEHSVTPKLALSIQDREPKPDEFYVTLEQVWHRGGWKKVWNIDEENIVILGCTKTMTINSFVAKCKEKNSSICPGKMWRVFWPNNMPELAVWTVMWHKRKDYLVDFTDGQKTLKDIRIGPKSNRLLYFFQVQFDSKDEP